MLKVYAAQVGPGPLSRQFLTLADQMKAAIEHKPPAPILLGRHLIELGVAPGPRMGDILRAVYEWQLDGQIVDLESARAAARRHIADLAKD